MLITEFGDAFKKIRHLHAHSHRLVPKQKIPFSFKFQITFFITWNFEILDTVFSATSELQHANHRKHIINVFKFFIINNLQQNK